MFDRPDQLLTFMVAALVYLQRGPDRPVLDYWQG